LDRREFIKMSAGVLTAMTVHPGSLFAAKAGKNAPNLLIIHTDEHSFRTLGCYRKTLSPEQAFVWGKGNEVKTPHIDALAQAGALCTNFYASCPVCSPSRASFLTGQYPQSTPVLNNDIPMQDNIITFASILQQQGYVTGYAGKWHLNGKGKPQWEPKRKFGFQDNRFMFNRGHWKQLEDTPDGPRVKARRNGKPNYNVKGADKESFTTDWLANKAIAFLEENKDKDKPFCYMLSIPDPHGPDSVRPPYDTMYRKMKFKKPRTAKKDLEGVPSWAAPQKSSGKDSQYFGMVKCIDDNVGKVIAALKKNGLIDNTIIVFTADHGDLRGEHGRQNKGVPLEASAKIPFVLRYPEKVGPGTIIHESLSCVDFLPTILSLMGVRTAGKKAGRDASPLFVGKTPTGWKDITFMRGPGALNWVAALDKRYKLVLSPKDPPWLIDKEKDPDELINFCLNPEYRGIVRKMATSLAEYAKTYKDPALQLGKMQFDLKWAMSNKAAYDATNAPALPKVKKKKGRKRGRP